MENGVLYGKKKPEDSDLNSARSTDSNCSHCIYGELIVLGYNGVPEEGELNWQGKSHRSKMVLKMRKLGNGVQKGSTKSVNSSFQSEAMRDSTRHFVSFSYDNHTVIVEYVPDPSMDMFQIGRSTEPQIDFTVVDTWLNAGNNIVLPQMKNVDNMQRSSKTNVKNVSNMGPNRSIASTISRYACRILVERSEPHRAYVFAAGFDKSRNIVLGQKAIKWNKENGEDDALTTNGIWLLHPNQALDEMESSGQNIDPFAWREVSVGGDVYEVRELRSSSARGNLVTRETNELQDGSLIDLCGATLLWRTPQGLAKCPNQLELESMLNKLNAGKPQCPVNLNTLIIPRKKCTNEGSISRQPYVYLRCGHVQGKHDWGVSKASDGPSFKCPICLRDSQRVVQLVMGMESAFHLDSNSLDYCFNPCGHVASLATVRYWSRIPVPYGAFNYSPVCPFCTSLLDKVHPYIRLIFQDHCYEPRM